LKQEIGAIVSDGEVGRGTLERRDLVGVPVRMGHRVVFPVLGGKDTESCLVSSQSMGCSTLGDQKILVSTAALVTSSSFQRSLYSTGRAEARPGMWLLSNTRLAAQRKSHAPTGLPSSQPARPFAFLRNSIMHFCSVLVSLQGAVLCFP
jgi:hypothetical protein